MSVIEINEVALEMLITGALVAVYEIDTLGLGVGPWLTDTDG